MRFSMVEPPNKTWTLMWSVEGCFDLRGQLSISEYMSVKHILINSSYFPLWKKNYQLPWTWYDFWLRLFASLLRCRCRQARWEIHYDICSPVPETSSRPNAERLRRTARRRGNQLSDLSQSGYAIQCLLSFCFLHVLSFSPDVTVSLSKS